METTETKELTDITQIEGTPFTAIRMDNKYFLALGRYRLTNMLDTFEQAKEETENVSWDRIMQVIQVMIEENNKKTKQ